MRSSTATGSAGNAKMRGKKHMVLRCRCCDVTNFCDKMREQEADKEIEALHIEIQWGSTTETYDLHSA